MQDMEIPDFLQNYDEDDIQDEMLALIPDEYDKSEGSHYYNFTRPTAVVVSQLRGYDLPEAIKLIWPKFSHGEYLDLHAELRGLERKAALNSTGEITIKGRAGTVIPSGYTVSTESKNDVESKDYVTTEQCVIGETGEVTVKAEAAVAGKDGDTAINTVIVNTSSYDDVISVTNNVPFTGGIDEEDDDNLYARIREYDHAIGDRDTGNPSDYKRWAESVSGTGTAKVIRAPDNSGLVTIILTDGNGNPASEELCKEVYNYIMSPDDEYQRLAPCGAFLSVVPPSTLIINISASVELTSGTIEEITKTFSNNLKEYFQTAIQNKEILYQKVCNIFGDIEGVYDFSNFTINGGTVNIPLDDNVFPYTDNGYITLVIAE